MNINLKEIVGQVIDNMEKENTIQNLIEKELTATIKKAISESVGGYHIRNQIEDKLEKEVSTILKDLDLKSFNSYVVQTINEVLVDDIKDDLKGKIEQELKLSLNLLELPEVIKLSTLLEKIREYFDESMDYDEKEEIDFALNITLGQKERTSIFSSSSKDDIELKVNTENDSIRMTLWHMNSDGEDIYRILGLYINNDHINNILKEKKRLSELEIYLAKMHLQNIKIEKDVDQYDLGNYAYLSE